ncbi:MAG: prepilin-type N-terminal cleavage/methylation domain-containing protein [Candidatus Omnitrophica bacterium]|nr:prepilin-type N-terminal cleavage/methylation domain-containing protein [Candidatus Omnitrophota bacterium]
MLFRSAKSGFTLMEVMFSGAIMLVAIGGLLGAYVLCFNLSETARNLTLATNAIQQKLEEIRYQKLNIVNHYDYNTFDIPGFAVQNAKGVVYVDAIPNSTDLKRVTISVSWRQKGGRIIGADNGSGGGIALNGVRDGTEQADANGYLKSPAIISEVVTDR